MNRRRPPGTPARAWRWHILWPLLIDGCEAEDLLLSMIDVQAKAFPAWIDDLIVEAA